MNEIKKISDEHFIQINPLFLLNLKVNNNKAIFKSHTTPWIYLLLKLNHNATMQYYPDNFYEMDFKDIAEFLGVDISTVYRCINELIDCEVIEKEKKEKYRLIDDIPIMALVKYHNSNDKVQYLPIFKNYFLDLFVTMKEKLKGELNKEEKLINLLRVFYYLLYKNGHYLKEIQKVVSEESESGIAKALGLGSTTVKNSIYLLTDLGCLSSNLDGERVTIVKMIPYTETNIGKFKKYPQKKQISYTEYQKNFYEKKEENLQNIDTPQNNFKEPTEFSEESEEDFVDEREQELLDLLREELEKAHPYYHGLWKSFDGKELYMLRRNAGEYNIRKEFTCKINEEPLTEFEKMKQQDLLVYGRSSEFFDFLEALPYHAELRKRRSKNPEIQKAFERYLKKIGF